MRVFLAGATGVIGRRLVPALREAGHTVVGATRSESKTGPLRDLGAEPVVCDALDADGLRDAVVRAAPDAVIHELTDIPANLDPKKYEQQMAGNDRLRVEGTANLVAAARAAGVERLVAQSIAFAYAPAEGLATEDDPLYDEAPGAFRRSIGALHSLEDAVGGIGGVVLRYGYLYGPGTSYDPESGFAEMTRKRRLPVIGDGGGVWSWAHVEDCAAATVVALERAPAGIYNVCDDDPAPVRDWLPAYAEALGAPRPRRVPAFLARLIAGQFAVYAMTQLRGASNAKFKDTVGWEPRFSSWRDGFRQAL